MNIKKDNLSEVKWKAQWINRNYSQADDKTGMAAPYLRKPFILSKNIKSARLNICGLGYHEVYINGKKAGDDFLSPAFTRYDIKALYNTYDISANLNKGENVIGVILGNGMYNVIKENAWDFNKAPWRHYPKMIAQMEIIYENGEEELLLSDNTWKTSEGPVVYNSLYEGEIHDARLELNGWCDKGYDDTGWENASICSGPGGRLEPMLMEPCRITEVIVPKAFWEVRPGTWVYDMGRNITGWVRLKVKGKTGDEVTLKYAEKLDEHKDIDQSNISGLIKTDRFQTDTYILGGEDWEIWEPKFTYHGFQYVQVTGFPGVPDVKSIKGCRAHTDFRSRGYFKCSNELLNSIQEACRLSALGNYNGMPTDCPHREKNGWTGDAVLSAEQMIFNFDPIKAYYKWLGDMKDVQRPNGQIPGIVPTGIWGYNWGNGPAWDSALILIPWYLYLYYGDTEILRDMYDSMKQYLIYMTTMAVDDTVDFGLGDWCPPAGGFADYKCPTVVTDTGYYYNTANILAETALILGKKEDSIKHAELAEKIKHAFNNKFVDNDTGEVMGNSQTSYSCALYFGLVEGDVKKKVFDNLIREVESCNRHIDCGILGSKYVMHVLNDEGRADLAYSIATQTDFPGWGYWIEQGATTLWETWNGDASRNHHMFSDISAWFYKGLAGINPDPDEPGFKHIIIRPNPVNGLSWVNASHDSVFGRITCNWKIENGTFYLTVKIPENCRASVYLPSGYKDKSVVDFAGNIGIIS